jgi:uncharacterized damage-inducible protein DinB
VLLRESQVCRLRNQHAVISEIIRNNSLADLHRVVHAGKWTPHDNVAHIARYQPIFLERLRRILDSERPEFLRYSAEADPEFDSWRKLEAPELIRRMHADRTDIIEFLAKLTEHDLERTGIHPKFGEMNVEEWTEFFLLHEAHHLFTIFQLVKVPLHL